MQLKSLANTNLDSVQVDPQLVIYLREIFLNTFWGGEMIYIACLLILSLSMIIFGEIAYGMK